MALLALQDLVDVLLLRIVLSAERRELLTCAVNYAVKRVLGLASVVEVGGDILRGLVLGGFAELGESGGEGRHGGKVAACILTVDEVLDSLEDGNVAAVYSVTLR